VHVVVRLLISIKGTGYHGAKTKETSECMRTRTRSEYRESQDKCVTTKLRGKEEVRISVEDS
jgi:hypothetical protein